MVSVGQLYKECCGILANSGDVSAEFDVSCIMQQVLGLKHIFKGDTTEVSKSDEVKIRNITEKCAQGQPLQYLLGCWEFYGREFFVGEGVLIPRQDTETLVEFVIEHYKRADADTASLVGVDLCAGSGCIGITLEKELGCDITCIEKSQAAFDYLERNLKFNGCTGKAALADVLLPQTADMFKGLDFIVSNPPYLSDDDMKVLQKQVSFEPEEALYGGEDGLDFYPEIIRLWRTSLKSGGLICFEIGEGQENDVSAALIQHGFENVRFIRDMCGVFRVVYGFAPKE